MSFFGKSQTRKRTMRKMKETEDEGNVTDDEGDDDEEDDGGYSVQVCRLCQW
jgi:hypothetical protein